MSISSEGWSVLVVDDETVDRMQVRRTVAKAALVTRLREAETIAEAREMLREEPPSCVIADMRLPDGEGLELVEEFPRLPFVVLTGHDDMKTARRALQAGAQDYLVKGQLTSEAILRSIRYAVERKHHQLAHQALAHRNRLASLGRVAASVAHEINNPIAFVATNLAVFREQNHAYLKLSAALRELAETQPELAEVLRSHPLPHPAPEVDGLLLESITGTERIVATVRQLGAFARGPTAGGAEEAPRALSLSDVAGAALRLTEKSARARASLITALDADLPTIVGRQSRLIQAVTNLIVNAMQAVPVGRADQNEIRVTTEQSRDEVRLIVEDSGPGFTDEGLQRALDPFFTTKAQDEGTGLGLAIVYESVRLHDGEVELENRPSGGARVTLRIPKNTGLDPIESTRPPPAVAPDDDHLRILLVDDEPAIRRAYQRMLRPHEVVGESGEGALERLLGKADAAFDLILCDLMMPGVDGRALYEALEDRRPSMIPRIVFLTGGVFDDYVRKFIESIPNRVLLKPVSREQLLAAADTAIRRRQAERTKS